VEKAHPRVLDVLLQIMEEGRLTDAQGRTTSFSETVIILTSNMGSIFLDKPVMTDEMRDQVMEVVRTTLRPEFLNRLDEIIMFLPLTSDQLRKILELLLKKEAKMLQEQGVTLEISEAAVTWMLAQNDHPEWGARPLRRIIQKNLREPLADWLLTAAPEKGARVAVDEGDGGLTFSTSAPEAPAASQDAIGQE
jgi:ATP-dependent Clp protease ATP-binding subunit ClpA